MLRRVTMEAPAQPAFRRLELSRFAERTLPRLAVAAARRRGSATFLHFLDPASPGAPARAVTFAGFAEGVARAAALFERLGVEPGDRVLFLAENSPEWQMLALGAQALRAEPAALFTSLGAEAAMGIARRVRPRVAVVSGPGAWAKLAPASADLAAAGLRAVLSAAPLPGVAVPAGLPVVLTPGELGPGAPGPGLEVLAALARRAGEEDPFLLLFTSGTTGRPKGVRLAQRAIVHAIDAGALATGIGEADLGLHFLPFAHVAGHDQFALALAQGHPLVMTARREDLERGLAMGPTYLFSVPLVYERIREAVEARLAGLPGPLRRLARGALSAAGRARVDGSTALPDRLLALLADGLVGRAVRARLGGRVRGLFAGGAPASPALFRFYESLGLPFVELYGMSETAGMISSNLLAGPRRPGVAGLVTPDHEVRLGPDGELLLRGPLLLSGHLEPEDDRAAFDPDGFFHTGDLVRADEEGCLRVEGRKKHVLVLSTGKKLSPEPIELAMAAAPGISAAVLLGEGLPFVSAVVFVARDELARLAAGGGDPGEALLPRVRAALSAFSEYERPKRLLVLAGELQEHPELLTPTLKVRRDALVAWLGGAVAQLYARG
jgi:long-chain acyl-CoA synthetase